MKTNFILIKPALLLCSIFLMLSCAKDELTQEQISSEAYNMLTDVEALELCKLGLDASQLTVEDGFIVGPMDYAINREDLNTSMNHTRHAAVGFNFVPHIYNVNSVSIYIDPTFTALGLDWFNNLLGAVAYINNVPHSRVMLTFTNSLEECDIWLFSNEIDPSLVSDCYIDLGSLAARGEFPLNEEVGKHISIDAQGASSIMYKDKLLIHEISHNLGYQHACKPKFNDGSGVCSNPMDGTQIQETWEPPVWNPDGCDSTSVMFPVLNGIVGGTSLPLGNYPYNMQPWLNDDDIFSLQGLYPIKYFPFSFEVDYCEIAVVPGNGIGSSATNVFRYHLNFSQNDFVPYQIDYELLDQNGQVVGSTTTYRYWLDYVDLGKIQVADPTQACLQMRITLYNYKKDVSNSYTSTNCCTLN